MKIQKLPLAERIQRSRDGRAAYPEYIPSIISGLGNMPVPDYLAGLDASRQERFRALAGLSRGSFTYQWAALRVSQLFRTSPALADEAMRILAAPMIRCGDLIRRKSIPPLAYHGEQPAAPGREDRPSMRTAQKLPLAVRLRRAAAKQGEAAWLPICRLSVTAFFNSLDDLLDSGSTYSDTLDIVLAPYLKGYAETPLLTAFVADSRNLPGPEQTQLLYQTLIQPFAALQNRKERMNRECMSLPF